MLSLSITHRSCKLLSFFLYYIFLLLLYKDFYVMFCTNCYHLYNLKNVENTHRGLLLLVNLQAWDCNFAKGNTSICVFRLFKFVQMVPNCGKFHYYTSLLYLNIDLGLEDYVTNKYCFWFAPDLKLQIFINLFLWMLPFYRILENSDILHIHYTQFTPKTYLDFISPIQKRICNAIKHLRCSLL